MKEKSLSSNKKRLDKLVSMYVRLSHADKNGYAECYTCGVRKHWKEMQCGHFVTRNHLATRFDLRNLRPQCVGCNVFGGGKHELFALKLEEGQKGIVMELMRESQKIIKDYPYASEKEKYKIWVKNLLKNRGEEIKTP